MSRIFVAAVLAAAVAVTVAVPGAAMARCLQPAERTALHVRVLQSDLMVASLSCRNVPNLDFVNQYNTFMRQHGSTIGAQSNLLRAYFRSAYGGAHQSRFDSFVSALANEASRQSMASPGFCFEQRQVFEWVLRIPPDQLPEAANQFAQSRGVAVNSCQPEARRSF